MKRLGVLPLMMLWCATAHGQTQHDRVNSRQSSNPGESGSPNGNTGDIQIRNGANFTAGGMNDNGTLVSVARDSQFKDSNPYVDVRAYGVRYTFLGQTVQSTCIARAGKAVVTTGATMALVNGDGFTCTLAGPAPSMSTPTAPTVTSGGAQTTMGTGHLVTNTTGGTTYTYCIVAVDVKHGLTACSPNGTTTTGVATMGVQTVSISSWTRTDYSQGYASTLTITTATPHNVVVGMYVTMSDFNNALTISNAGGTVLTVPDKTHFTIQDNRTVSNGAYASGTGGSFQYYLGNKISWTAVTGAFRYLIYRNGSLIGVSYPETTDSHLSGDPLKDSFEDYGAATTLPNPPFWAPASAPIAAANQDLTSTVLSGAGTTTLTLNAAATNSVAGSGAYLDNTPNFLSAVSVVCGGINFGTLLFPETQAKNFAQYQFYSIPVINCSANGISILQQGTIQTYDTFAFNTGIIWMGSLNSPHNGSQFAWTRHPAITTSTAYPLVYQYNSNAVFDLRDMAFIHNATNAAQIVVKDTGGIPAGMVRDCIFATGLGSSDSMSTAFVWRNNISGGANMVWERTSMIAGASAPGAPLWQSTGGGNPFHFRDIFLAKRGMYLGGGLGSLYGENVYEQGAFMPKLTLFGFGSGLRSVGVVWTDSIEDTTQSPAISYSAATGTNLYGQIYYEGNSNWGCCQGNGAVSVLGKGVTNYIQNTTISKLSDMGTLEDGVVTTNQAVFGIYQNRYGNVSQRLGPQAQFYVSASPPAKPTCTAVAGGTAASGTYTVAVVPVFRSGTGNISQGMMSQYCDGATINTGVSPGVQTIQITWTAVAGAVGYDLYSGPNGNGIICNSALVTPGTTTTYNWTNGLGGGCTGQPKDKDGGGPSSVTVSGIAANALRLSNSNTATIQPTTLTASRTQTLPDATGTFVLDSTFQTQLNTPLANLGISPQVPFDNFNRADGGLGSNWTSNFTGNGTLAIASHAVVGGSASNNTSSYYTGTTFLNDQYCEVTITTVPSLSQIGCVLRGSGTTNGTTNEYECVEGKGNLQIWVISSGSFANLGNTPLTAAVGDRLRCTIVGISVALTSTSVGGVVTTLGPITDSHVATGSPGIVSLKNSGSVTNWTGGSLPKNAAWLNGEQEFQGTQHIYGGALEVAAMPATTTGTALTNGFIYARGVQVGNAGSQLPVTVTVANGTATLGTGAIDSATCASVVTVAGTGIATTDTLTWSFNADTSATTGYAPAANGSLYIFAYPTANNANFKVCNSTARSITPGAATLNWKVVR